MGSRPLVYLVYSVCSVGPLRGKTVKMCYVSSVMGKKCLSEEQSDRRQVEERKGVRGAMGQQPAIILIGPL
ncbi:MAG TPA: hypothetical protein VHN12_04460, partial [Geobacteraceae bacterium]|nr:hypothetical protein [Geobacteraceae bacterium]